MAAQNSLLAAVQAVPSNDFPKFQNIWTCNAYNFSMITYDLLQLSYLQEELIVYFLFVKDAIIICITFIEHNMKVSFILYLK